MPSKGTVQQPQYETKSGVVLDLKPIKRLILERFRLEYLKANPAPEPIMITLSNGDVAYDIENPVYLQRKADHDATYNLELVDFIFKYGVLNQPPAEWVNAYGLGDNKVIWLNEVLDDTDMDGLTNAIFGLGSATEEGIEDEEKK